MGCSLNFAGVATYLILGCRGLLAFELLSAEKLLVMAAGVVTVVFRCGCVFFMGGLRGGGCGCYGWVNGSVMINMFRKTSILCLLQACNDSHKMVESAGDRGRFPWCRCRLGYERPRAQILKLVRLAHELTVTILARL